jgi:hypothetical protein
MATRCFCSIVSLSHLGPAASLARCLLESGNKEKLHLLVTDIEDAAQVGNLPENLSIYPLRVLKAELPPLLPFYFDKFELCNALKPFFLRHLLAKGMDSAIYLDTDIYVVDSFQPVWEELGKVPFLLTPHNLKPIPLELGYTTEIAVADQGIYNGGFLGCRAGNDTAQILDWMRERFPAYGFNRRSEGMFVDQKLLPLLPVYFPEHVLVWREPAVNIAFWNLHERGVKREADCFMIDGTPVIFFHMSGYRTQMPHKACSYLGESANRKILTKAPWFCGVMGDYHQLLQHGRGPESVEKYKYGAYRGIPLSPAMRTLLYQKQGNLRWGSWEVLKIFILDRLKILKRKVIKLLGAYKD